MGRLQTHLPTAALALASTILAAEPLLWLLRSWQDPAYQSIGHVYFGALAALILISLTSGPAKQGAGSNGILLVFLAAATLRLLGQVFAVNILSALALAVDVFAIARILRLDLRPRALSPFWLAVFFLFALPLSPILERVLGFPLQMISARLSCAMLGPFFTGLECQGVRLKVNGADVLVDLPCSGATGLLLMLALWTGINAWSRPRLGIACVGLAATLIAALLGNGLRISLLAAGLGLGIDTMAPTLHTAIGLFSLAVSAGPLLLVYRPSPVAPMRWGLELALPRRLGMPAALASVAAALWIVAAPEDPVDRSGSVAKVELPDQLLGHVKDIAPLTAVERHYFEAYGGVAQKAHYGALGLNVVQTGSPLRHLHSPATCLLGMGYDVVFLGTRFEPVPTSVYRATGPDGQVWHVSVSFVSHDGYRTASVGEAVWIWLTGRSHRWTSVQRITPTDLSSHTRAALDSAALAALDV